MVEVGIFFTADSDLSEYEATSRGYRVDVYVKIKDYIYQLNVFTILRLQQEFEDEIENDGFYIQEPNLVLVKDTNKNEIINTINNLFEQRYFDKIKATDYKSIDAIKEINGIKFDGLIKVQ